MSDKEGEVLTPREQLLSLWLFRRAVPAARPRKFTRAWAVSFFHWYARSRYERACRLADAEDDKLLCRALAGDAQASVQLGRYSYSDPRRRRWEDFKYPTLWQNAVYALCVTILVLQVAGNILDWVNGVDKHRIHEYEQCGPFHHWINVGGGDLSCEADR
jgi:hypothetical protein